MSGQIERIEKLAAERNMKMSEFKRKIGVTAQQYNHWKQRNVPMDYTVKIANLFTVDVNWLATGEEAVIADKISVVGLVPEVEKLSSVKIGVLTELFNLFKKEIDFDDVLMIQRIIGNTNSKYQHPHSHA